MLEPCNLNRSFPAHYCIVTNGFFMILLGEKAGMINTTNYYRYRAQAKKFVYKQRALCFESLVMIFTYRLFSLNICKPPESFM